MSPDHTRAHAGSLDLGDADFIGVDVGGTKVSVAIMHRGTLGRPHEQPTELSSQRNLIDQLQRMIELARSRSEHPVAAVGIGVPSVIDVNAGRISRSENVPLADVQLARLLSERLGEVEVFVENDANCAGLAEAYDHRGRLDCSHLVMFTVGTGVGGAMIIDGRPYRGATGAAGELGHMIIGMQTDRVAAPSPSFPQPGSLEALASGRALDRLAVQTARSHPSSVLARSDEHHSPQGSDLVRAARDGDRNAIAALELFGHRLGVGIANAINIFDPQVVAIGGGVSRAHELLLDRARTSAMPLVLPGVGRATEIRLARSGAGAGVRGAALLAWQRYGGAQP